MTGSNSKETGSQTFKKDITVPTDSPFEWMGKMFAEQMRTFAVEHQAFLAECRADLAEAKSDRVMIIQSIREAAAIGKDDIADSNFEKRVNDALSFGRSIPSRIEKEASPPVINVTVPVTLPGKGKEVTTFEQDEYGRIKRSVKEAE